MNDLRLAVLIDADNVPYSNIKGRYGRDSTLRYAHL